MNMVAIKLILTTLFAVLLASSEHCSAHYPSDYGYGQTPIKQFVHRLRLHLLSNPTALKFKMRMYVLQDLEWTSNEFQALCLTYERQYGNPVTAVDKAIYYIFYYYEQEGDEDILKEIEKGDPVGFNVYLTRKNVDNGDHDFTAHGNIFVATMRDRIRLQKMRTKFTDIPQDVRYEIATEYSGVQAGPLNYFIKFASKQSKKKMYPIDLVVLDQFDTYKNTNVDDVQVFAATYYNPDNSMLPDLHALCINYKASTKKVHIYDSNNSGYLEGRQKGIIEKLYPNRYIKFEKSTALQGRNPTCAIFAMTYATMLLLGRDPAKNNITLNEVHGDETLYMRLHIMEMLSRKQLFLPN